MTDNEIIKALEEELKTALIINHRFEESNDTENPDGHRFIALLSRTIKLINRQKAEIERLKDGIRETNAIIPEIIKKAKKQAIKEFAERLKELNKTKLILWHEDIDNLVKEMVGEQNG